MVITMHYGVIPSQAGGHSYYEFRIFFFSGVTRWVVCIATILFVLTGCSLHPKDRFIKNIKAIAHKDYNISNGELLAKYNLIGFSGKNMCVFAKNYGDIIGNENTHNGFLKYMPKGLKKNASLTNKIAGKIGTIYDRLDNINKNHHIITKAELHEFKILFSHIHSSSGSAFDLVSHSGNHNHDLNLLAKVDKIIDNIPVFVPFTDSIVTSKFGRRQLNKREGVKLHAGVDLAAAKFSNIYASAQGVVKEIAASPSYGNFILIEHKKNIKTRYAHLSKLYVSLGEKIFQGQLIGKQGSTGKSHNDHLHFEILIKNHPVDPMGFIGKEHSCRKAL